MGHLPGVLLSLLLLLLLCWTEAMNEDIKGKTNETQDSIWKSNIEDYNKIENNNWQIKKSQKIVRLSNSDLTDPPDYRSTGSSSIDSLSTDFSSTDPSSTDPSPTDLSSTHPSSTDPSSTDPSSTHPSSTDPSSTHPSSTDPSSTDPSTTDALFTDSSSTVESTNGPTHEPTEETTEEPVTSPPVTDPPGKAPQLNSTIMPEDGKACIYASLRIMLLVPYRNIRGKAATIELAVPSYAESGGDCAADRQELYFMWNWQTEQSWRLTNIVTFAWTPIHDDQYALSSMSMGIYKTSGVIPDLHPHEEGTNATARVDQLSMFAASKGKSYACATTFNVDMSDGFRIMLSDVHLQAFNEDDDTFSAAESCPQPRTVTNGIYIALATILACFALAAVSYVVYYVRMRWSNSQRPSMQFNLLEEENV